MSETGLILLFWAGVLGGVLAGAAIGWWRGMTAGVAAGCLVIGLCASSAASLLAWQRWQFVAQSVQAVGVLQGHANGPQVEFRTPDGAVHAVHGLGGSQSDKQVGDAVPVRYARGEPATAIVADVQNLWGGVLAFAIFGALPLAFGLFFLGVAREDRRGRVVRTPVKPVEPVELSPMRRRFAGNLTIAGNLVMLAAFGSMFMADDTLLGVGRGFLIVGLAALLYAASFWLRRDGDWQASAICLVVALGFTLFGGGAMLLGR